MAPHSRLNAAFESSEKDGNRLAVFAASLQFTDEVKDLPSGTPWSRYKKHPVWNRKIYLKEQKI